MPVINIKDLHPRFMQTSKLESFVTIQKQPPGVFYNKRCQSLKNFYNFRNFTKFTGKHLYQSLFFNKVAGLNFIKKETQVFSCEFCEICENNIFYRTPGGCFCALSVVLLLHNFNWRIQVLRRFKSCSGQVRNLQWKKALAMVPASNRLSVMSSGNHSTKPIYHGHHLHIRGHYVVYNR